MIMEVRLLWLVLVFAAIVASNGCRHKPAYSEIDENKTSSTHNQSSESKAGTPAAPSEALSPTTGTSQPASSPPSAQQFKTPTFMDQASGAIRDLPNYPGSIRTAIQIGPNQGFNVMTLALQTRDSMDRIAAFYKKAIKDNHWTVVNNTIDPEMSDWTLEKGAENSAKIQVKKDPATSRMSIIIVRGEKLPETK